MTKFELACRLFNRGTTQYDWQDSNGRKYVGQLDSIQREDGSGSSFNVTISYYNDKTDKSYRHTFHSHSGLVPCVSPSAIASDVCLPHSCSPLAYWQTSKIATGRMARFSNCEPGSLLRLTVRMADGHWPSGLASPILQRTRSMFPSTKEQGSAKGQSHPEAYKRQAIRSIGP